jgi:hypothetical protein
MSDVFLARSPCDDAKADALLRVLRAAGIDVRETGVAATAPEEARTARCVVVAWSACSVEIPWVRSVARDAGRRDVLVPVLFDDVLTPVRTSRIAPVDLRDWTGAARHPALAALRADIATVLRRETAAPPAPAADAAPVASLSPTDPDHGSLAAAAAGMASVVEAAIEVAPRIAAITSRRSRVYRRVATVAGGLALVGQIFSSATDVFQTFPVLPVHDPDRLVVGVMNVHAEGAAPAWAGVVTRDRLNAILNRFRALEVMSKQQIAFVQERDHVSEIEAARVLGIERMISGTLSVVGRRWKLMVEVVDPVRGSLTQTEEEEGSEEVLAVMQNRLAAKVIRNLGVKFDGGEIDELVRLQPTAESDDFRRLMESMGEFADEPGPPAPDDDRDGRWRLPAVLAPPDAFAATTDDAAIRAVLEEYREALEAEDMARLDRIHAADNPRLRAALARYLANATDLAVELSDVVIAVDDDTALATFTRRDVFRDAATGRDVQMELRVSNALVRRDGRWLILGAKR